MPWLPLACRTTFWLKTLTLRFKALSGPARPTARSLPVGTLVSSPAFFITIALNGRICGQPMLRSAAVSGDVIGVTGPLGLSRGGLELMMRHSSVDSDAARQLVQAHRHPIPRLQEGRVLLEEGVRAAMDVSDGLVDDLKKMMLASGTAARIFSKEIAIHPSLGQTLPEDALNLALAGGEEYELLFTASSDVVSTREETSAFRFHHW